MSRPTRVVVGDFDYDISTAQLELGLGLSLAKRNLFLAHLFSQFGNLAGRVRKKGQLCF